MENSIILNLRGGGADAKRREARKRKFALLQANFSEHEQRKRNDVLFMTKIKSREEHSTEEESKRRELSSPASVAFHEQSASDSDESCHGVDQEMEAPKAKSEEHRKPQRFICFVGQSTLVSRVSPELPHLNSIYAATGNLPYSTTTAALGSHFAKIQPSAIRHPTSKETGKSKGFAFLEFEGYDRMKTCLQLYHGSFFEVEGDRQGKNQKEGGRKIKVELTAGGGGSKSRERKSRLIAKNAKLQEERRRRTYEDGRKARKKAVVGKGSTEDATKGIDAVHPSRRARVVNN